MADGDLVVDPAGTSPTLAGRELALTAREFDLLRFLVGHPGVAFSRDQLLRDVWGWSFGDQSTVTVHVRRLREKVEADPTHPVRLVTVWGVGYRWERRGMSDQVAIVLIAAAWSGGGRRRRPAASPGLLRRALAALAAARRRRSSP